MVKIVEESNSEFIFYIDNELSDISFWNERTTSNVTYNRVEDIMIKVLDYVLNQTRNEDLSYIKDIVTKAINNMKKSGIEFGINRKYLDDIGEDLKNSIFNHLSEKNRTENI